MRPVSWGLRASGSAQTFPRSSPTLGSSASKASVCPASPRSSARDIHGIAKPVSRCPASPSLLSRELPGARAVVPVSRCPGSPTLLSRELPGARGVVLQAVTPSSSKRELPASARSIADNILLPQGVAVGLRSSPHTMRHSYRDMRSANLTVVGEAASSASMGCLDAPSSVQALAAAMSARASPPSSPAQSHRRSLGSVFRNPSIRRDGSPIPFAPPARSSFPSNMTSPPLSPRLMPRTISPAAVSVGPTSSSSAALQPRKMPVVRSSIHPPTVKCSMKKLTKKAGSLISRPKQQTCRDNDPNIVAAPTSSREADAVPLDGMSEAGLDETLRRGSSQIAMEAEESLAYEEVDALMAAREARALAGRKTKSLDPSLLQNGTEASQSGLSHGRESQDLLKGDACDAAYVSESNPYDCDAISLQQQQGEPSCFQQPCASADIFAAFGETARAESSRAPPQFIAGCAAAPPQVDMRRESCEEIEDPGSAKHVTTKSADVVQGDEKHRWSQKQASTYEETLRLVWQEAQKPQVMEAYEDTPVDTQRSEADIEDRDGKYNAPQESLALGNLLGRALQSPDSMSSLDSPWTDLAAPSLDSPWKGLTAHTTRRQAQALDVAQRVAQVNRLADAVAAGSVIARSGCDDPRSPGPFSDADSPLTVEPISPKTPSWGSIPEPEDVESINFSFMFAGDDCELSGDASRIVSSPCGNHQELPAESRSFFDDALATVHAEEKAFIEKMGSVSKRPTSFRDGSCLSQSQDKALPKEKMNVEPADSSMCDNTDVVDAVCEMRSAPTSELAADSDTLH